MARKPITVHVTATDIRRGKAGDCNRCAVALALQRATKGTDIMVFSHEWTMRLGVDGRSIIAPHEVREFVQGLDDLERTKNDRPKLPRKLPPEFAPFSFELPATDDPEWQQQCGYCGELCDDDELDDDHGYCRECVAKLAPSA